MKYTSENLPSLTGTDKQIAYANDLRCRYLNHNIDMMQDLENVFAEGLKDDATRNEVASVIGANPENLTIADCHRYNWKIMQESAPSEYSCDGFFYGSMVMVETSAAKIIEILK